jgi:hypothetical protein
MKKTIWVAAVLAAELLASQILQAQGSLYVSNLGQTSTGSMGIGSNSQPSHKGEKLRISLWFSKESCSQPRNEI